MKAHKLSIGAVSLVRRGAKQIPWKAFPIGDERIEALCAIYRGESTDFEPCALNPFRRLTRDEIDWDSAGARITGDGPQDGGPCSCE